MPIFLKINCSQIFIISIIIQMGLLLGDLDYPIAEAIIFFILIASLVFNTFLFQRGDGTYSIKYELMRNQEFFRRHIFVTYIIEGLYKFFFFVPFILLITLSVMAAIRDINMLAPILINGLIILLILYPFKKQYFFIKVGFIWALAMTSQLSTFFLYEIGGEQTYFILSAIFYTGNVLFFYLATVSIEKTYWELSQGVKLIPDQIRQVNQHWNTELPKIFDGGLYGFFCKNQYKYLQYIILYFISLIFLGVYAFLVHHILNSSLGIVGLVSTIIYDIFVKIFNSLQTQSRTLKTLFPIIVFSRFFSFVFGLKNWLLGYCVLYFFLAIFIGWIIIDKHFPLTHKKDKNKNSTQTKFINGFNTPQFVILLLTVQIIIMIVVEAYALTEEDPTLNYNNVTIPTWQWGILAIIGAWVFIFYLLSLRVLARKKNKIFEMVSYYFGFSRITEYHIYVFISYLLLIAIGLYATLYLQQKMVLICCIFLPLIYLCLMAAWTAWSKNQFDILAKTEQYNNKMKKKQQAKQKKAKLISLNQKLKETKKLGMISSIKKMKDDPFMGSFKLFQKDSIMKIEQAQVGSQQDKSDKQDKQKMGELSGTNLFPTPNPQKYKQQVENEGQKFVPLRDWREESQAMSMKEIWQNLTPNDKKIIFSSILFLLLTIGFCLTSMLWGLSKLGISIMVCIISYLTLLPFVKFFETRQSLLIGQAIGSWIGFALGITYWSVFNSEVVGPIAYSIGYIVLGLYCLIQCYKTELNLLVTLCLGIQILGCIIFIEITLSMHKTIVEAVIFGLIFFILIVLQLPLYFVLTVQYVPKLVIILCSILIGGAVIFLSVLGYIFKVLGSFSILTIIMCLIFIAFLATSLALYYVREKQHKQNPCIYSAYGFPNYRFDSGKEVLKQNNAYIITFSFSKTTLVIFSGVVSVFFVQKQWAVFGLSLFLLLEIFVHIQTTIISYLFLGVYKKKKVIKREMILDCFNKLRTKYLVDERQEGERLNSQDYKIKFEQAKILAKQTDDPDNYKKAVFYHDLYIKHKKQEQHFGYFWIALITFTILAKKRQRISTFLAELKSIEQQLMAHGIVIECLDSNMKPSQKYNRAQKQIDNLPPLDFLIYEQILQEHRRQQQIKNKQIQHMRQKQKKEIEKRDEQLFIQMKKNQSVLELKDQVKQFQNLIKSIGKGMYQDSQFPADQTILGNKLSQFVISWRRPDTFQILIKDGITEGDVKQGQIGDCYLISSFAVLGEKRIRQSLGFDVDSGIKRWQNDKGAYMIRFFKFSKEKFIIIDDLLPVNDQSQFVFARSQEQVQFWPSILQKAYAKLYGGYHRIIEGKSHQVLADFTGGFPWEVNIEDYKSNPNGLWTQIISSKKNGYLLAAGSPPNPQGDAVCSKRGIVQGHAYSVLDAKQVDQFKLIKLKNPHASVGREWTGDFSDKSDLMSKRVMGLLGHTKTSDGIFWMTIEDFIIQLRSLYICAVFDKNWVKFGPINGRWTIQNSFGPANNIGAEKNPHYGLKVTKKCTFFVSLSQQPVSALKGENYIYMKALKNNGKRITPQSLSQEKMIGKAKKPTNAAVISTQLELEANQYPYTFSLMVSCQKSGVLGEYTLQAYCDDQNAQLIDDKDFDRPK